MLKSLKLTNFTAFSEAEFQFSPGLNVIVGANSTGKTHIMKAAYSVLNTCSKGRKNGNESPTKSHLKIDIARELMGVFKPDSLGRLTRRDRHGKQRCEVACTFSTEKHNIAFSFQAASKSEVTIDSAPSAWIEETPVFLPTRELLTIYPGFVSLYETTHSPFESTWRDTCVQLGAPLARGPREKQINESLSPLEDAMGGKVELDDSGRFYLNSDGVRMEMHLVAEGLRKLAMIARLIAAGSLSDKGYLFWDEPEANLNPKMIKVIARTILNLCRRGIQVFIASHSLFLMRELDILMKTTDYNPIKARFFGLHIDNDELSVCQGDSVDDIGKIDALEEELSQSDRYLDTEAY